MQVRYTAPHGQFMPGDVVEVPDGSAFSADYLEPVEPAEVTEAAEPEPEDPAPDPPADPAEAEAPRLPYPKEM